MGYKIRVFGDRALFSRPELKVERYSYDIPTPSSLVGIAESIYWHPGLKYVIDRVKVINPIERISVKRNELKSKVSADKVRKVLEGKKELLYLDRNQDIAMRNSSILTNVEYIIEYHFELIPEKMNETDSEAKFASIINRRIEKGQCYKQPYFGCREFPAYFERATGKEVSCYEGEGTREFGLMLYGMDYSDPQHYTPMFFNAVMENGVDDMGNDEECR